MTSALHSPASQVPQTARGRGRTGVVVCGGASRRMGRDKAGLEWAPGVSFLAHAIASLRPVVDEVLLATGPTARYAEFGWPIVLDRAPDLGPLGGLEAALRAARHERLVVLAVDMPGIDRACLRTLAERAERDDLDAVVLGTPEGLEPLCGVYHVRLGICIQRALDAGERRMTAPFSHPLADGRLPRLVTVDAGFGPDARWNVNTQGDLARARGLHAEVGA